MLGLLLQLLHHQGLSYPSHYWHFNDLSYPGPGLTVVCSSTPLTTYGALVADPSTDCHGIVNPTIQVFGDSTWILRYYVERWEFGGGGLIDFGSQDANNRTWISLGSQDGGIQLGILNKSFICDSASLSSFQWNTAIITIGQGSVRIYGNGIERCSWSEDLTIPNETRTLQFIGKSLDSAIWYGFVDFVWYLPRVVKTGEAELLLVDSEIMGNAWTFQSSTYLPKYPPPDAALDYNRDSGYSFTLLNAPSLLGGTLNLHGDPTQGVSVDTIGLFRIAPNIFNRESKYPSGPTSFALRVRLDDLQPQSPMISFATSPYLLADVVIINTGNTSNSINWTLGQGFHKRSMECFFPWQIGQWVDIVLTVEGNHAAIYKDGVPLCVNDFMWEPKTVLKKRSEQYIGKSLDNASPGRGWNGSFESIMMWPRAISAAEAAYISDERVVLNPWLVTHFWGDSWDYPFSLYNGAQLVNGQAVLVGNSFQYLMVDSFESGTQLAQLSSPFSIIMFVQMNNFQYDCRLMEFSDGTRTNYLAIALDGLTNNLQYIQGDQVVIQCNNFFTLREWVQISLIHNGTTVSLYKDGLLMCSNSSEAVTFLGRQVLVLGWSIVDSLSFDGSYDYFMVFNKSLNATQIAALSPAWDRYFTTCAAVVSAGLNVEMGTCVNGGTVGTTCDLACKFPYAPFNAQSGICTITPGYERALWTGQSVICVTSLNDLFTVTSVTATGCAVSNQSVYDCPTTGNVIITVNVSNYQQYSTNQLAVSVGGLSCVISLPIVSLDVYHYSFNCILPPGTGYNRSITLQADRWYSSPQSLLSYAAPNITKLTGCNTTGLLKVTECARKGGDILIIWGVNFGPAGASGFIGTAICVKIVHDPKTPHFKVRCTIPPGSAAAASVQLHQANTGPFSSGDATLGYSQCPLGSYQDGTQTTCQNCSAGRYSDFIGQSSCSLCEPGHYTNQTRMSACVQCSPGYYQPNSSAVKCSTCESGFSSAFGQAQCTRCVANTVSTAGMTSCVLCQLNSIPNNIQSHCECSPGFYEEDTNVPLAANITTTGNSSSTVSAGTGACKPCPSGTVCTTQGLTRRSLPVQDGYFLTDAERLTYQKCLSPKYCVGGQCIKNRTGLLCSLCDVGYTKSEWTKECTKCGTTNYSRAAMAFTIVGLLIAVLVLYGYIIVTALKSTTELEAQQAEKASAPNSFSSFFTTYRGASIQSPESDWRQLQHNPNNSRAPIHPSSPSPDSSGTGIRPSIPNLVVNPNLPKIDDSASVVMQHAVEKNDHKQVSDNTYVLKILVNFFQVASSLISLPVSGAITFPTYYMAFLSYFKFLSIDFIPWQNVGCLFPGLNVYSKLLTLTLVPVFMVAILALVVTATVRLDVRDMADTDHGRTRRKKFRLVFLRGAIFTAFMLYPLVSSAVLSHFACLTVGRRNLLLADLSIVCKSEEWKKWTPFVVVMTIIYPIGIPLLFFVLLYRNRKNLRLPEVSLGLGFLYESYTPQVWWFEVLVMLEKLALTSLLQLLPLNLQLGSGIVVVAAFLLTLVLVQPELRHRNWSLHMLANVEILMLLLLWHFSYQESAASAPFVIDASTSALFILLTAVLAALLFLDLLRWLKDRVWSRYREHNKKQTQKN